jgi:hypothetical protein
MEVIGIDGPGEQDKWHMYSVLLKRRISPLSVPATRWSSGRRSHMCILKE